MLRERQAARLRVRARLEAARDVVLADRRALRLLDRDCEDDFID